MYQVYVALGWLKAVDVIRQHGREGYTVEDGTRARERMRDEWAKAGGTRLRLAEG